MIWLILLLAFGLRLIAINQSLWLDEADNVWVAGMFDLYSFITKYSIGDYHPPGYFFLIWVWTHVFGFSEAAVRMPSIILGLGTIAFTYLLGKEIFDKKIALVAALFLAVAPLHVYYSQEARMYSLSAFTVSALSYFLIQLLKGKRGALLGYTLSAILVLYSDYVTYLIFPAHFIYLCFVKHSVWRKWSISLLFSILAFLPWLVVFPKQILEGREAAFNLPGWKKVAGGADFKNLALVWVKIIIGRISFENKIVYAGVISVLSVFWGLGILRGIRKTKEERLLILWIAVPLILAWGISFYIPMLSYFRLIFILPAFYLLAAKGFCSLPGNFSRITIIGALLSSLVFLGFYYTSPKFQREDWRGAANLLNNIPQDNSIILFEDNHVKFPYLYYQKNEISAFGGLKKVQARSIDDVKDIEKLLNGRKKIYLFEYLVEITDPARLMEKKIKGLGFTQKDVYNFNGVGLIRLYER